MRSLPVHSRAFWCCLPLLALLPGLDLRAVDNDGADGTGAAECARLHESVPLAPPEDALNQDAHGFVHLRQRQDRMALHVIVRDLEPGATYDVSASREVDAATEMTTLGTLTTRDAVPPPPRCFRATLESSIDGATADGDGEGEARTHREQRLGTRAFAALVLNSERTELNVALLARGLEGEIAASIDLGNGTVLELDLDENGRASLEVDENQVNALASGDASVLVKTDAGEELSGPVVPCLPFLESLRALLAERLSGSGALRLDTGRGDEMPFAVSCLADLSDVTIEIRDTEEQVVLAGTIEELTESDRRERLLRLIRWFVDFGRTRTFWPFGDDPMEPEEGSDGEESDALVADLLADVDDRSLELADDTSFFSLSEPHDASFVRGDVTMDGVITSADPVRALGVLFLGEPMPYCPDSMDSNDDSVIDVADPIATLWSLFLGQGPLPPPATDAANRFDQTEDELFCQE